MRCTPPSARAATASWRLPPDAYLPASALPRSRTAAIAAITAYSRLILRAQLAPLDTVTISAGGILQEHSLSAKITNGNAGKSRPIARRVLTTRSGRRRVVAGHNRCRSVLRSAASPEARAHVIDPALMMASSVPQRSIGHQAECQRPLWRRLVTRRGDVVYSDFLPRCRDTLRAPRRVVFIADGQASADTSSR